MFKIFPLSFRLSSLIKKNNINLVHINTNIISGLSAILASRIAKIPCICHVRQTRRLTKIERFFVKWVDRFIVINQKAEKLYLKDIPREKVALVYDGINLDNIKIVENSATLEDKLKLNNAPCVGVVSRLVEGKGHDDFIKAAAIVAKHKPDVKFFIVGSDSSKDKRLEHKLRGLAKDLRVSENIIFTGWRNDVLSLISLFDILVHPSSTFPEGLPNAILEGQVLKKPVIATDIPGSSDAVLNGQTGILVAPGDSKALAESILSLLDNPALAKQMGVAGRKRFEDLFNMKNNVEEIQKIYGLLLN